MDVFDECPNRKKYDLLPREARIVCKNKDYNHQYVVQQCFSPENENNFEKFLKNLI